MRYILWLPLRVSALILLSIVTVFGFLRALLRGLTGADQVPPSTTSCLVQFILLPIYAPVAVIYLGAFALYHRIIALDVKFGFAKPDETIKKGGDEEKSRRW